MTKKKKAEGEKPLVVSKKRFLCDELERLKKLYQAGFTDEEIRQTLKIGRSELYDLKLRVPGGKQLIDKWKEERVDNVINALYEKALGKIITIESEKAVSVGNGDFKTFEVVPLKAQRYEPPDFQAIKFFLTNLAPHLFKDKSELVLDNLRSMSDTELEEKVKAHLEQRKQDHINELIAKKEPQTWTTKSEDE